MQSGKEDWAPILGPGAAASLCEQASDGPDGQGPQPSVRLLHLGLRGNSDQNATAGPG